MPDIVVRKTHPKTSFSIETTNSYPMNDLQSVYTHYDPELGKNVPTENKLPNKGDDK